MPNIKPIRSDCCEFLIASNNSKIWKYDMCSKCRERISYAFVEPASICGMSLGVCRFYDETLYFFYQQVSRWDDAPHHQQYIGQIKSTISTIGMTYNTQDIDMIPFDQHKYFSDNWKSLVRNPEMGL